MRPTPSYVLVTPARNEVGFIEFTIQSVVRQTLRPLKWIIVSDGSTDGTDELVSRYTRKHSWIHLLARPPRQGRHFAGKVHAFNAGYDLVKDLSFQIIGNLDGDISFEDQTYFEFLMNKFADHPQLGVCGTAYREGHALFPGRFTSLQDVFGACQMFRRECFESIGGYPAISSGGIDLIAFLKARHHGWQTWTFTEKVCVHHRPVGSGQHANRHANLLNTGRKDYVLGCHPVWEVFRSMYYMKSRPWIVGGLLILFGYIWARLTGVRKTIPADLLKVRQEEQLHRLKRIVDEFLSGAGLPRMAGRFHMRLTCRKGCAQCRVST